MQGSLGAGVLPYKESGNRRRDLVGGGEGRGAAAGPAKCHPVCPNTVSSAGRDVLG